jgi:hypothetical protein
MERIRDVSPKQVRIETLGGLAWSDNADDQLSAAAMLFEMCKLEDGQNEIYLRGLPILTSLLQIPNSQIRTHVLRAVALLSQNEERHTALASIVPLLINTLLSVVGFGVAEKRVLEAVMAALTNLAKSKEIASQIGARGLGWVLPVLSVEAFGVQCNLLAFVGALAQATKEQRRQLVRQDGLITALFRTRDVGINQVKLNARYALRQLGYRDFDPTAQYVDMLAEFVGMGFEEGKAHLALRKVMANAQGKASGGGAGGVGGADAQRRASAGPVVISMQGVLSLLLAEQEREQPPSPIKCLWSQGDVQTLMEMGFSAAEATRALEAKETVAAACDWLLHQGHTVGAKPSVGSSHALPPNKHLRPAPSSSSGDASLSPPSLWSTPVSPLPNEFVPFASAGKDHSSSSSSLSPYPPVTTPTPSIPHTTTNVTLTVPTTSSILSNGAASPIPSPSPSPSLSPSPSPPILPRASSSPKEAKGTLHLAVLQAQPLCDPGVPGARQLDFAGERLMLCDSFRECGRQMAVRFCPATTDNLLKMITKGVRALHISGHGDPSRLVLEDGTGTVTPL